MTRRVLLGAAAIVGAIVVVAILVLAVPLPGPSQEYGVSFSAQQAEYVGVDWKEAYDALLDDLGVRRLRLAAYWGVIEPQDGVFDFSELDYQMDRAAEVNARVIVAVGRKLPRWPECHTPEWAAQLPEARQQAQVLEMLEVVVKRYQDHPALYLWQLENEPLLDFGICPPEDRAFLAQEELLLRSLDSSHPILITDSGELNSWLEAGAFGDQVGTTMYRTVHSKRTNRPFSYDYIFPAWLYRLKGRLVYFVHGKDVLISELQGEPWGASQYPDMTVEERRRVLSPERLQALQRFAARTGFPEAYWWGAEYWYWEKEVNGEPIFWETARGFFK